MNIFSLTDKRILVTGASSGIGRACAIMAAELGAKLVLTGRRESALDETLAMCKGAGHGVVAGDITSEAFIAELAEKSGKVDGLVHAAGIGPMCPIGMITAEHVEEVMRTNYYAFLNLMKVFSRRTYRADGLSVVVISSVSAFAGWGGGSVYCGSKGALISSVRALSVELAAKGIRVNAICPSNIKTPLYDLGAANVNGEESLKELLRKQPLGLGQPDQVAAPVCFLLSDAASFITGTSIPVDGGYLAQ